MATRQLNTLIQSVEDWVTEFENRFHGLFNLYSPTTFDSSELILFQDISKEFTVASIKHPSVISVFKDFGNTLFQIYKDFETSRNLKLNKQRLYFYRAICSIHANDELNAVVFWDLALSEARRVSGKAPKFKKVANEFVKMGGSFSSLYKSPKSIIVGTNSVKKISKHYSISFDLDELLDGLTGSDQIMAVLLAIRFNKIERWLSTSINNLPQDIHSIRTYGQELINGLALLCESSLKSRVGVTGDTFGAILNRNVSSLDMKLSRIIGVAGNSPTGLFAQYRGRTNFSNSFKRVFGRIERGKIKSKYATALLIYMSYLIRNHSLHKYTKNSPYYKDPVMMRDVIGLLFVSLYIISKYPK